MANGLNTEGLKGVQFGEKAEQAGGPPQPSGEFNTSGLKLAPTEASEVPEPQTEVAEATETDTPYSLFKEQVANLPKVLSDTAAEVVTGTPKGVMATPEVASELGLGMLSFVPTLAAKMERQARGAVGRLEGLPGNIAETFYEGLIGAEVPEETPEQTIKAATAQSEQVHKWMKEAFYAGMAPEEQSKTAKESLEIANVAFSAPRKYVFEPVGKAYGMLTDDKVAGAMATDAMESVFWFAALPKAHHAAKKRILRDKFNKAWEKPIERDKARQAKVEKEKAGLKEGKTREQYYKEGTVEDVFGTEAAREVADAKEFQDMQAAAEGLKEREYLERQKMYDRLFNEKESLEFLKDVEDFALRRETGQEGRINAVEVERLYQNFLDRKSKTDLEFRKDWENWKKAKRRLDEQGVQPVAEPFIDTSAAIARHEGTGAASDLKFGIEARRPYPKEQTEPQIVPGKEPPTPLRETLGHKTDRSLKQKMALESARANRRRTKGDPLASGKAEPAGEKIEPQRNQGDVLQDMGQEVLEQRGLEPKEPIERAEPRELPTQPETPQGKVKTGKESPEITYHTTNKESLKQIRKEGLREGTALSTDEVTADKWMATKGDVVLRVKGKTEKGTYKNTRKLSIEVNPENIEIRTAAGWEPLTVKAKAETSLRAENIEGFEPTRPEVEAQAAKREAPKREAPPEETTLPASEGDAAVDIAKHEARVKLIKERAEKLKETKYRNQVSERLETSEMSEELKDAYRDMIERDPESVDAAVAERSGKKPVDKELQLMDDMQGFLEGEDNFMPEDSFFIENMKNDTIRSLDDIVSDLREISSDQLKSERGSFSLEKLTGEQKAAVQRLTKDIQTIARNAHQAGKKISEYLIDLKVTDPETAKIFEKYADEYLNQDKIEVRGDKATQRAGDPARVDRMFEKAEEAKRAKYKKSIKEYAKSVKQAFVDRSNLVTETLEADKSKSAEQVMNDFAGVAGAGPKAKSHFETVRDNIYGHLTHGEVKALDKLIAATKEIDVAKRHPKYRHPTGTIAEDYHAWMAQAKERLGLSEESWTKVNQAARDYFDTFRDILEMKRSHGATPEWLYELLKDNKYSPTRWLYIVDAYTWSSERGGSLSQRKRPPASFEEFKKAASEEISSTGPNMGPKTPGVERLKGGYKGYQEMNSQYLLANAIGETHKWIAKNKASKGLARHVEAGGGGDVFRRAEIKKWTVDEGGEPKPVYKKPPEGMKEIFYFDNGQRKAVWAKDWFAEQWRSSGSEFRHKYAGITRGVSFSPVLREFATGAAAPFFFLKGLPMDTAYSYMSAMYKTPEGKYKSLHGVDPVSFGYSMGKNLAKVAPDVFLRKGRYWDFINEYGSFNALTETGGASPKARGKIAHGVQTLRDYSSYMNRTAEFWVRLANREKYMDRGYSPEQASLMARRVLDFHQGGEVAKFIDNAIPYTNVSIQAMRGIFGAAKKNPGEFAIKAGGLAALSSSLYMYNMWKHRKAYEQESNHNKDNYFMLPTGFSLTDARGNEHHINLKLRKDPETRAISTLAELTTAAAMGEEADFKRLLMTLKDSAPYLQTIPLLPSAASALTYATNTDLLTLEKVWKGEETGKYEWYANQTSKLYKDLGGATGMSPERLKASVEAIITRDSIPAKLLGSAYDAMFRELPKEEQETFVAQFFLDNWASSAVSVTSETTEYREDFSETEIKQRGKRLAQNRILDNYARAYYKDNEAQWEDISKFISKQPRDDQKRLKDRLRRYVETMNLDHQSMWMMIGGSGAPRAKAKNFHQWWSEAEGQQKREIEQGLFTLKNSSSGIIPKELDSAFWKEFNKLRAQGTRE